MDIDIDIQNFALRARHCLSTQKLDQRLNFVSPISSKEKRDRLLVYQR